MQVLKVSPGAPSEEDELAFELAYQWRICFRWREDGVHDVEIVDCY